MDERIHDNLITSPAPHILGTATTAKIRGCVLLALLPTVCISFYLFGMGGIGKLLICVAICLVINIIGDLVLRRNQTAGDLHFLLTGMFIYCLMPVNISMGALCTACGAAMIIGKYACSFSEYTNFSAAALGVLVTRAVFSDEFAIWAYPGVKGLEIPATDVVGPTPLAASIAEHGYSFTEIFMGFVPGAVGTVSIFALLVGGLFLVWKKVIDLEAPAAFLVMVFLLGLIAPGQAWVQLLSGDNIFAAVFLMTEYSTAPKDQQGRLIFGGGIGVISVVSRWIFGANFPGALLGIVIMNALVHLIDNKLSSYE